MNIMKGMYFVNRYSAILEFLLTCLRESSLYVCEVPSPDLIRKAQR